MEKESNATMRGYFDINIRILKICGLWVPPKQSPSITNTSITKQNRNVRFRQLLYNTLLNFYCLCLYQPAECAILFASLNLGIFVRSLRDQFNHHICIYKIIRWFTYRKRILAIMETLRSDEFIASYEPVGDFHPREIVANHKLQADRWMKLFLFGVNFICINMCISVFYVLIFRSESQYEERQDFDDLMMNFTSRESDLIYAQKLPVFLITPFKMETRMSFVLHFVFEILPLDIYAWMIVGLDCLFTTLMSCVSAHLTILCGAFSSIRARCIQRLNIHEDDGRSYYVDEGPLEMEMTREIRKCTQHLQMLIRVSKEMEQIYYIQTCAQVMVSLFEMCFCLYLLSTSISANFGNELTYLFSTAFELLLYCWFGNGIIESSAAIPEAIFNGDWLSASTSFKKSMLITMTRMRKPLYMSIGKFTPLTFTTFISIARVAYSFFTVLSSDAMDQPK